MKRLLALSVLMVSVAPAQERTAIQSSGEEVLVDVVVRDKKGRAVTSLPESAFTVVDEGAPVQISSFRLVRGDESVTSTNGTSTTTQIVYRDTHNSSKPEMFIEFNRDGYAKRVAAVALGAADSEGRIQYVANVPIDQFDRGGYAVRFAVRQGAERAEEDFSVNLEP